MSNIVLISYPSGGFGHFVYHALTCHGSNTFKTKQDFSFSKTGDSHSTQHYIQTYYKDPDKFEFVVPDQTKTCLILCDNGVNNDSYVKLRKTFPTEQIIRLVIDPDVRPVIYSTCVIKAMRTDIASENAKQVEINWDDSEQDYAKRENFTLMYHQWPYSWGPVDGVLNISIEQLYLDPVSTITDLIHILGDTVEDELGLDSLCAEWKRLNTHYFEPYELWKSIESALDSGINLNLSEVADLHTQGYINFRIEEKYKISIPVFDYRYWFEDTHSISRAVRQIHEKTNSDHH